MLYKVDPITGEPSGYWGSAIFSSFPNSQLLFREEFSSSRHFSKIRVGGLSLSSIGPTLNVVYTGRSFWDGQGETPNSKSILYIPGINIILGFNNGGGIGINIAKGFEEYINDNPSDIDEKLDILTLSINYRTILNQRLDWFW